jgi:hypothetical protein
MRFDSVLTPVGPPLPLQNGRRRSTAEEVRGRNNLPRLVTPQGGRRILFRMSGMCGPFFLYAGPCKSGLSSLLAACAIRMACAGQLWRDGGRGSCAREGMCTPNVLYVQACAAKKQNSHELKRNYPLCRGKLSPIFILALVIKSSFSCGVAEICDFVMVLQGLWSARG